MTRADTVRAIYARWAEGDFSSVAWAAPDIQLQFADALDNREPQRGLEAVAAYWREFLGSWRGLRCELHELVDGGERILAVASFFGESRVASVPFERILGASVFTFRDDGLVKRLDLYRDIDAARRELG